MPLDYLYYLLPYSMVGLIVAGFVDGAKAPKWAVVFFGLFWPMLVPIIFVYLFCIGGNILYQMGKDMSSLM